MTKNQIEQLLSEKGYQEANEKLVHTSPNTFAVVKKSSFAPPANSKYDNRSNRAQSLWKMSEHVIIEENVTDAYTWAGKTAELSEKQQVIESWKLVTSKDIEGGQKLYLSEDGETFEQYDSNGNMMTQGALDQLIGVLPGMVPPHVPLTVPCEKILPYLAAIRTKPFILLAGISGTGKSRMVRQLARGCCPRHKDGSTTEDHPLYNEQKPGNFEMIPVRPNWHDSTELMGYVSRITGTDVYQVTDFLKFLCKAWRYEKDGIPFFLCLDEMNLAPVEQYFAEFLSVIETRKKDATGNIITDPLVTFKNDNLLRQVIDEAYDDPGLTKAERDTYFDKFKASGGIPIPSNLVVMGTVNMDETTCTFSRKVLDRAMSFELNDVSDMYAATNLAGEGDYEFGSIDTDAAKGTLLTGKEAYDSVGGQGVAVASDNTKVGDAILAFLENLNEKEMPAKKADGSDGEGNLSLLAKTPFKIAYRSRNEIMIYCIERIAGNIVPLPLALDEALSMKVLSRIEGDSQHIRPEWLQTLSAAIVDGLSKLERYDATKCVVCKDKLADMVEQAQYGYTSFWMR